MRPPLRSRIPLQPDGEAVLVVVEGDTPELWREYRDVARLDDQLQVGTHRHGEAERVPADEGADGAAIHPDQIEQDHAGSRVGGGSQVPGAETLEAPGHRQGQT